MSLHDLQFVTLGFFSEILGTLSGFGSSTFFVPLAIKFESFQMVLVLTAILHTFGNITRLYTFKKNFDKAVFLKLAMPSIVMSGVGAMTFAFVSRDIMKTLLGFVMILLSVIFFFKGSNYQPAIFKKFSVQLMAVSGFLTGFLGTGGAVRGLALSAMSLPKDAFIFLSSSIDIGGDLLRLLIYLQKGFMDWTQWHYIPMLALAGWGGSMIGKKLVNQISQEKFSKIVSAFVFLSGISLFFKL